MLISESEIMTLKPKLAEDCVTLTQYITSSILTMILKPVLWLVLYLKIY